MHVTLVSLLACFLLGEAVQAQSNVNSIFLRLYNGDTLDDYVDVKLQDADELVPKMDVEKWTMMYIHGYSESSNSNSTLTIAKAHLKLGGHNVITVDYEKIAGKLYPTVANSAKTVGLALAKALTKLTQSGVDPEKVHIIGHSLGAQVAGYIGRNVNFKVPRITGLDPAGPLFYLAKEHLSAKDGRFVDIIHTDYGFYGIGLTTGTVDFFPNGGKRIQPGCPDYPTFLSNDDFCSHHRSWVFYAESIYNKDGFLGVECSGIFKFMDGSCAGNKIIPMGYNTPFNATGVYYLQTTSKSPYVLGLKGTKYTEGL